FDGSSKTDIAAGQYPRPPDLRGSDTQRMSDGELFYHIKNGIRHTGMPAWELPDRQLWQVAAYLRNLPKSALSAEAAREVPVASVASSHYVGSAACKDCHKDIYARWSETRMANVVRDPRDHPDAITPDLSKPDPLLTFTKDDIAFVYGSKWKQRYFKKVGDDYFVLPSQWDVTHQYRPNIINPAKHNHVQANDVCIQCHSQGQPLKNPIQGKYYDWPVGFDVGKKLVDYWKLEEHKLGETSFTHFPEGSAHKNRMQGNDFVQSLMYTRGVACFNCHDVHGTKNDAILWKPANKICFDCHGPNTAVGPHAPTIEAHTHHKAGSTGNECVACHMPKIAQTIADVNVRAHTFRFITPVESEALKIPNAC